MNLFVDCDRCFSESVSVYALELKITIDAENVNVPITFYKGNVDDGEVIAYYYANTNSFYTDAQAFGHKYSAVAKYSHNGRIIYAVDGKELRKKYDNSSCDGPCYIIRGDVLDLRLK